MLNSKTDIRKEVRARKRELSPLVFSEESRIICEELTKLFPSCPNSLRVFPECSTSVARVQNIVAYWPMNDELDIRPFLEKIHDNIHYSIYLPVITGDGIMEFRLFEGKDKMAQEPQFGIWEPTSKTTLSSEMVTEDTPLTIIVPGIAFTPHGDRLGRGKGFYDRILTTFQKSRKIGVCLSCQIFDKIPIDPHDQRMDLILSPILLK